MSALLPTSASELASAAVDVAGAPGEQEALDGAVSALATVVGARAAGIVEEASGSVRAGFLEQLSARPDCISCRVVAQGRPVGRLLAVSGDARADVEEAPHIEEALGVLAAALGVAVARARVLRAARTRQRWLEATAELGATLLGTSDRSAGLDLVVERARQVADAALAVLLLRTAGDVLVVEVSSAEHVSGVPRGTLVPRRGTLCGQVLDLMEPIVVDAPPPTAPVRADLAVHDDGTQDAAAGEPGPALLVPLGRPGDVLGVLAVTRRAGAPAFADSDIPLAESFAASAAFAIERARAQADREALAVLEDRDRIARDLHDLVIQRLFATGLSLQSAARSAEPAQRPRLESAVDSLDETIRDIRTTIFQLHRRQEMDDVRGRVHDVLDEAARPLGCPVTADVRGPLETLPDTLAEDLVAVLRESLSNVARHAAANRVHVALRLDEALVLVVQDDGRGFTADPRGSGVRNMRRRAQTHGGSLRITPGTPRGTRLEWRVPLPA